MPKIERVTEDLRLKKRAEKEIRSNNGLESNVPVGKLFEINRRQCETYEPAFGGL